MSLPNITDAIHMREPEKKSKKKWVQSAVKNKGALHRHLGIPEGETIPEDRLAAAAKSKDATIRKEANLAMTLKGMHKKKKEHSKVKHLSGVKAMESMYGATHKHKE